MGNYLTTERDRENTHPVLYSIVLVVIKCPVLNTSPWKVGIGVTGAVRL